MTDFYFTAVGGNVSARASNLTVRCGTKGLQPLVTIGAHIFSMGSYTGFTLECFGKQNKVAVVPCSPQLSISLAVNCVNPQTLSRGVY